MADFSSPLASLGEYQNKVLNPYAGMRMDQYMQGVDDITTNMQKQQIFGQKQQFGNWLKGQINAGQNPSRMQVATQVAGFDPDSALKAMWEKKPDTEDAVGSDEYIDKLLSQWRTLNFKANQYFGQAKKDIETQADNIKIELSKYNRGRVMMGLNTSIDSTATTPPPSSGDVNDYNKDIENANEVEALGVLKSKIGQDTYLSPDDKQVYTSTIDEKIKKIFASIKKTTLESISNIAEKGDKGKKAIQNIIDLAFKQLPELDYNEVKKAGDSRITEINTPVKTKTNTDIVDEVAKTIQGIGGLTGISQPKAQFSLFGSGIDNIKNGLPGTAIQNFIKAINPGESVNTGDVDQANLGTMTDSFKSLLNKFGYNPTGLSVYDVASKLGTTAKGKMADLIGGFSTYFTKDGVTDEKNIALFMNRIMLAKSTYDFIKSGAPIPTGKNNNTETSKNGKTVTINGYNFTVGKIYTNDRGKSAKLIGINADGSLEWKVQ